MDSRDLVIPAPASDATLEKPFELDVIGVLFEEFLNRHSRHAEDERWLKEFKAEIRRLSNDAEVYRYKGRIVAVDERNGKFALSKLAETDPDLVAQYTHWVTTERFDEEAFRQDHPKIWAQMRAQSFKVK
jgi:hypothetical protein